jgi:hypothetical protein
LIRAIFFARLENNQSFAKFFHHLFNFSMQKTRQTMNLFELQLLQSQFFLISYKLLVKLLISAFLDSLQIAPEIAAEDELFDEISQLNQILEQIPSEIFDNETSEKKWMKIFNKKRIASSSLQIGQFNLINSRIEFLRGKRVFNDQ